MSLMSTALLRKIFGRGIEEEIDLESEAGSNSDPLTLPEGDPGLDRELVQNSLVGEAMMLVQELPRMERRRRNKNLIISLRTLNIGLTGAFIWMKAHLHPSTCKTILADFDFSRESFKDRLFDRIDDSIEKAKTMA